MCMEITKMSFSELEQSKNWERAVLVFTKDSFNKEYSEEARSYEVYSDNKYFNPFANGNSLYGSCLDGTDNDVRLEHYMHSEGWKVDYCYITEHKEELS
jgi:hypothetical protein